MNEHEPSSEHPERDPDRVQFLLRMYDQMMGDINRHILVVWQSVGAIGVALASFPLVEKGVLSLDLATAVVNIVSAWLCAHIYDSAYWYNRNLVIIANIERQFLLQSDLREIHYYFGKHRAKGAMLTHLRIQLSLGVALAVVFNLNHLTERVLPGIGQPWSNLELQRCIPYAVLAVGFTMVWWLRRKRIQDYRDFLEKSPGACIHARCDIR